METSRLSIDFLGRQYINPFLLASGPPTRTCEMIDRAFAAGWGGAVVKTIASSLPTDDVQPRFAVLKHQNRDIGFQNIEMISHRPIDVWVEELGVLRKNWPDRAIWGSIMAGMNKADWQRLAIAVQKTGVDLLELNVSCPNGMPGRGMGAFIGQSAELTAEVVRWVKAVAEIPVIVKLTPNVTDIAMIAEAAQEAGADGFCAINTMSGISSVDTETLVPTPNIDGYSCGGGISGPAIRPFALRAIADVVRATNLPISGSGGIVDWQNAIEFFALGAGTVQLCTEPMRQGFGMITKLISGLEHWLDRHGKQSLSEIIGLSLDKVVKHENLSRSHRYRPTIPENCNVCGRCVTVCADAGFHAISRESDRILLDQTKCDGCGLCDIVCHVRQSVR